MIIRQIGRIRDKANSFLMRELADRNMKGIAPTHGDILWALYTQGELPMNRLAEMIHRDKSTVTALVNKLVEFGYVQRKPGDTDSRISMISLTDKGLSVKQQFYEVSKLLRAKAYKGLSEEERKTLMALLTKVHDNL